MYKILAMLKGWKESYDEDEKILVVYHTEKAIHYSGSDAWKLAAHHKFS